jgi:type I restriction enzyme S subunit
MSETDAGLSALLDGWAWTKVKEVAEFIRGVSYKKSESSKTRKEDSAPILRANNINRQLNYADLVYVPRERIKDEQFIKAFDIVIAMSSGSKNLVGKAAQSHQDYHGGFGTFCGLIRVSPQLDRKFIGLFFQSPGYRNKISRLSSGMNINNLRGEHIRVNVCADSSTS